MSNQLINIIIIIGITVAITAVTILLYFSLRKRKYDTERHKALLDEIRYSLEKQMYVLTDRLMKNEERWRDVNHLLLRKEYTDDRPIFTKKRPILNDFLVANGIREQDLTVDKDLIFVLTPFHPNYFEDYDTIRKICLDVGFDCKRGDEDYHPSDIFPEMLKLITKANLIIANVNGRNPNVLYELGIAQALDKPVILIAKNPEDIPIDIKSKRFLIYSDLKDLENLLKTELIKILKSQKQPADSDIEIGDWKANTKKNNPQWTDYIEIDLQNNLLERVSCTVSSEADYYRFGFKLLERTANIFEPNVLSEKSLLLHIGKNLSSNVLVAAFYFNLILEPSSPVEVGIIKAGDEINLRLEISKSNELYFFVNNRSIYKKLINYNLRERLMLMAWGDNYEFNVNVRNITVKTR